MISAITNTSALSAQSGLTKNLLELNNVLKRLSTGKKINSGADNPAALIAAEQMSAELAALEAESSSLRRADANANITDGYMSQVSGLMAEMNGLVVASANTAGMSADEIAANQMQIDSISASIQTITGDAISSLNGINIPNGGNADVEAWLTGAAASAATVASGGVNDLASGNFDAAQTAVKAAIYDVASARGKVGAYQKYVVEASYNSKQIAIENITSSRSRLVDTDYAIESSNLTRMQILAASGIEVLKIAQFQSTHVLDLLSRND